MHDLGLKIKARGYAAKHSFSNLKPFEFERSAAKTISWPGIQG
jgi:hypothetical protein